MVSIVTDPDACMMYIVSPLAGMGGGILLRPPAYTALLWFWWSCKQRSCLGLVLKNLVLFTSMLLNGIETGGCMGARAPLLSWVLLLPIDGTQAHS